MCIIFDSFNSLRRSERRKNYVYEGLIICLLLLPARISNILSAIWIHSLFSSTWIASPWLSNPYISFSHSWWLYSCWRIARIPDNSESVLIFTLFKILSIAAFKSLRQRVDFSFSIWHSTLQIFWFSVDICLLLNHSLYNWLNSTSEIDI